MSLESRIPKFPKFSKFPIFPRFPKFSDKQSVKDCPLSPQIICCQSGAYLPPIKILGWMGHTIMYFPFSPMIEVAKERHYHNKLLVPRCIGAVISGCALDDLLALLGSHILNLLCGNTSIY